MLRNFTTDCLEAREKSLRLDMLNEVFSVTWRVEDKAQCYNTGVSVNVYRNKGGIWWISPAPNNGATGERPYFDVIAKAAKGRKNVPVGAVCVVKMS